MAKGYCKVNRPCVGFCSLCDKIFGQESGQPGQPGCAENPVVRGVPRVLGDVDEVALDKLELLVIVRLLRP